jgi:hypothetical protein
LLANNIEGNAKVQFINVSGQVIGISECNFVDGKASQRVDFLSKGVNFAMVTKDNTKYIAKFIVQ